MRDHEKADIKIPPVNIKELVFEIIGKSKMVCCDFVGGHKKENGNGYPIRLKTGEYGLPLLEIQRSLHKAAQILEGYDRWEVRSILRVLGDEGDLVKVESEPVEGEPAVIQWKGKQVPVRQFVFPHWKTRVTIVYDADLTTEKEIKKIMEVAGRTVGVGEGRPLLGGSIGIFSVKQV